MVYVIVKFNLPYITADPREIYEYHKIQNEKNIPTTDISSPSNKTFTLLLLNTRSFPKHAADISKKQKVVSG